MKSNPIADPLGGLGLIAGMGAAIGLIAPYILNMMMKKGSAMTALEKALGSVMTLLWQKVTEYETQVEKLQKELSERPIQAQIDAANKRTDAAIQESVELREEVSRLRREITKLAEKKRKAA